jgi:circadian clock protein KaiC
MLVLGQHGLIGDIGADVDLSYLADGILMFRFFEAQGRMLKAVSVAKSRITPHESSIREFGLGKTGVLIGAPLVDFEGVLTGLPAYRGSTPLMSPELAGGAGG